MRNNLTVLAEKYQTLKEAPLEVEIISNGEHKSDHNVSMTRTKALQAADVAAELYELIEKMPDDAPMHAWKVTNVTQAADMLQDVLASLRADELDGDENEVIKTDEEES